MNRHNQIADEMIQKSVLSKRRLVNNQASRKDKLNSAEQVKSEQTGYLALVSAEAILVKVALGGLAPLLLLRSAATVSAGATWLLHLLVGYTGIAEGLLLLSKGLSAGAGSCPRIRLFASILQLPPVPLT